MVESVSPSLDTVLMSSLGLPALTCHWLGVSAVSKPWSYRPMPVCCTSWTYSAFVDECLSSSSVFKRKKNVRKMQGYFTNGDLNCRFDSESTVTNTETDQTWRGFTGTRIKVIAAAHARAFVGAAGNKSQSLASSLQSISPLSKLRSIMYKCHCSTWWYHAINETAKI